MRTFSFIHFVLFLTNIIRKLKLHLQIRGAQLLDATRLHKQGFPCALPFGEFLRRFRLLAGDMGPQSPVLDERRAVEDMMSTLDVDIAGYRVGLSQVGFNYLYFSF